MYAPGDGGTYFYDPKTDLLNDLLSLGYEATRGSFPSDEFRRLAREAAKEHGVIDGLPSKDATNNTASVWARTGIEILASLEALRLLQLAEDADGDIPGYLETVRNSYDDWVSQVRGEGSGRPTSGKRVPIGEILPWDEGSATPWESTGWALRDAAKTATSLRVLREAMAQRNLDRFGLGLGKSRPLVHYRDGTPGFIAFNTSARTWAFLKLSQAWWGQGAVHSCSVCNRLFVARAGAITCGSTCRSRKSRKSKRVE